MAIFHLLEIRTSIDLFKNEKCKVTFGLEYTCTKNLSAYMIYKHVHVYYKLYFSLTANKLYTWYNQCTMVILANQHYFLIFIHIFHSGFVIFLIHSIS